MATLISRAAHPNQTVSASAESTGEVMSNEDIIKSAAEAGTVGNWGLGNEYEIQALLTKYGEPKII
ncbi:MAG: hypothetical protein ACLUD0_02360 [Eubacterium ramulus]